MFGFLGKVKDFVSQNVGDVANKIKTEFSDLIEENRKLEEIAKHDEENEQRSKYPWETAKIVTNSNGNIRDLIREEILELSTNEENFLTEESSFMFEFEFNMEECKYEAIKMMEYDEKLGELRNKIVPAKVSDEKFWKNYFYNVEMIKMKYVLKAEEESERAVLATGDDDVLQPEEQDSFVKTEKVHVKQEKKVDSKEDVGNLSTEEKEKSREMEKEGENPDFEIKLQVTP